MTQQNLDSEDLLSKVKSLKNNMNSSSQSKIINIEPNKRLMLPQSIIDKYFEDQTSIETDDKNLLPDVFVSINKTIEKDANRKGINYIYDNILSLKSIHRKEIGESFSGKKSLEDNSSFSLNINQKSKGSHSTIFNLPKILPSYPLKYIINPYSIKKMKNEIKEKEYDIKKGTLLTENNFRSKIMPQPRLIFENNLKNEIKTENVHLITYLNQSKGLKAPFLERLSIFDNEHLKKLNKISQKTLFLNGQEEIIKNKIKNKIRNIYRQSNEVCKKGLETLKEKLNRYDDIIKSEEKKKIDKRERYLNNYSEAEKNWVKSNALRFYKKSEPPKNSATGLVIEK